MSAGRGCGEFCQKDFLRAFFAGFLDLQGDVHIGAYIVFAGDALEFFTKIAVEGIGAAVEGDVQVFCISVKESAASSKNSFAEIWRMGG